MPIYVSQMQIAHLPWIEDYGNLYDIQRGGLS